MTNKTRQAPAGVPLTQRDRDLLAGVDRALEQGLEIYEWWRKNDTEKGRVDRFPLDRERHRPDINYGFLESVPLRNGQLPVLGVIQDMFYDQPKSPLLGKANEARWMQKQIREFVLRYFMRISSSRKVQSSAEEQSLMKRFGPDYRNHAERVGWGYSQEFFKLKDSGEVQAFAEADRRKIIDLREIGTTYEWVVLKVNIFEFDVAVHLAGTNGPQLEMPVPQTVYTILTRDFVVDEENPRDGVLGEYGYGYAFLPDPDVESILAYGPNGLTSAFETIHFTVLDSGEVRAKMAFVANQPIRLVNFDPVDWSFELADKLSMGTTSYLLSPAKKILDNLLPQLDPVFTTLDVANSATGGQLAYQLGISKERLIKDIMALHFFDAYNFFLETTSHWKLVSDWLDEDSLPLWAREGSWPVASAAS